MPLDYAAIRAAIERTMGKIGLAVAATSCVEPGLGGCGQPVNLADSLYCDLPSEAVVTRYDIYRMSGLCCNCQLQMEDEEREALYAEHA